MPDGEGQVGRLPDDLRYTQEHQWLRFEGDLARIGITDYAQIQLGEVVFVYLPAVGDKLGFGAKLGEVESTKVTSEVFCPIAGEVVEINGALDMTPELVNQDPYGAGWFVAIRPDDPSQADELLDAAGYAASVRH